MLNDKTILITGGTGSFGEKCTEIFLKMHLKNKTILITGSDGFIRSHLTEALVKEGAEVKAVSCYIRWHG